MGDLDSILVSGQYCYEYRDCKYEIVLKFKTKHSDKIVAENKVHIWRKEEINDFEQKLALVDNIKDRGIKIQSLIKWNEVKKVHTHYLLLTCYFCL